MTRVGTVPRTKPTRPGRTAVPPAPARRKLSIKSQVSRALFFAITDAEAAQERDQQRQQDQMAILHQDVGPNWGGDPIDVVSTTLDDQQSSGQGGGSTLSSSGNIPPEYLQPSDS